MYDRFFCRVRLFPRRYDTKPAHLLIASMTTTEAITREPQLHLER